MPYVPAHTSAVGVHAVMANSEDISEYSDSWGNFFPTHNTDTVSYRFVSGKSSTVKGDYSPMAPKFRLPTAYQRVVFRAEDMGGGYNVVFRDRSDPGSQWVYRGSSAVVNRFWDFGSGPISLALGGVAVSSSVRNRAIAEALLKVQNMKVNLGAALGEIKTTSAMIASRLTSLAKCIRALRRGNFSYAYWALFGRKRGVQSSKTASEVWLEWQYGWMPLISDIVGGVEQIQQGFRDKHVLFSSKRTITQKLDPSVFIWSGRPLQYGGEASESCKVQLWGRVTSSVAALNSLGLINPLSLAWELTSLSFVIDWLIPIGNWLESLTATVGVEFVGGCVTDVVYADVEATWNRESDSSWIISGRRPKLRVRAYGMQRTPLWQWPRALPYWVNPLSTSHIASAAALVRTLK